MLNVTTASFKKGTLRTTAGHRWQYDKGQVLQIEGLNLPAAFEVDFSNQQFEGEAEPYIGVNNRVDIPDKFLKSGEAVYAFIYLHEGEDDGETVYRIMIPVEKRPETAEVPEPEETQKTVIDGLVVALNNGVNAANEAADSAWDAHDAIRNMGASAVTLDQGEEAYAELVTDELTNEMTMHFGIPRGIQGVKGDTGAVYLPHLSEAGVLSWTNDAELDNPAAFDIVGAVLAALPAAEGGRF